MVNVVQTASSGASSAAQFARAAAATAVLSTGAGEASGATEAVAVQPADQVVVAAEQTYRYNSFEFSYRQDFGKIVLLRQKPDTGEVVQQFPSEYYLRKYADGQRVVKSAADEGTGAKASAAVPRVVSAATGTSSTPDVASTPAPAPAPTIPTAPALPGAGTSGTSATVDLTV
ncbi:hypothetical protein [Dongia sp.]|jgi:hypothetical protein|uniref:hypothetical protein n=1 Tax=Dongia sp. TaxID=1977262 RepID=UPI0035AF5036